jgi:hypothetical protein
VKENQVEVTGKGRRRRRRRRRGRCCKKREGKG